MKEFDAVMPYDPVNDFAYINGIGSNETEAIANVDLCEPSDEVIKRIVYVPVKVVMHLEDQTEVICFHQHDLARFAEQVAASEREACARVCYDMQNGWASDDHLVCGDAIRNRSNAEVSGAGTASAGLPGYVSGGEE